ncbi:MAG: hypothetical protein ACRCYS_18760 [Beijerinckiaceae bacterium]
MSGRTYFAHIQLDPRGNFVSGQYLDENLTRQDLIAGTFQWGACDIAAGIDVFRVIQPLVAGNNVIAHPLGLSPVEVEVRNNATGAEIAVRVVAESLTSVTINVPVAVAAARISIDA